MKNLVNVFILVVLVSGISHAQRTPVKRTRPAPVKTSPAPSIDPGKVTFRTYSNTTLNFSVTFPESWIIPDISMEAYVKTQGVDLNPMMPSVLLQSTKNQIIRNTKRVSILLTAYKKVPGMAGNSVVRIAVEDLKAFPRIKDAVDYMDAMRGTYRSMQLPAGFNYSETQAEQLGKKQFAFLDIETKDDKRRLYATVKSGQALIFSVTYNEKEDLEVLRQVLTNGNFKLK